MNHKLCKNGHAVGPSSLHMQSVESVFSMLNLKANDVFLDLGCGAGSYALEATQYVGLEGKIYAVDISERFILSLIKESAHRGLTNLFPVVSDMTESLDLTSDSVDNCLISTVLHALDLDVYGTKIFDEVKRVLKDDGQLFIIECHVKRKGFGPPEHKRIAFDQLDKRIKSYGFEHVGYKNLGHNYMCVYKKRLVLKEAF